MLGVHVRVRVDALSSQDPWLHHKHGWTGIIVSAASNMFNHWSVVFDKTCSDISDPRIMPGAVLVPLDDEILNEYDRIVEAQGEDLPEGDDPLDDHCRGSIPDMLPDIDNEDLSDLEQIESSEGEETVDGPSLKALQIGGLVLVSNRVKADDELFLQRRIGHTGTLIELGVSAKNCGTVSFDGQLVTVPLKYLDLAVTCKKSSRTPRVQQQMRLPLYM